MFTFLLILIFLRSPFAEDSATDKEPDGERKSFKKIQYDCRKSIHKRCSCNDVLTVTLISIGELSAVLRLRLQHRGQRRCSASGLAL